MHNNNFSHFVLTRFNLNLRLPDNPADEANHVGISHQWLKSRFELFDTFCYPSLRHQTQQNFKWLVFFDKHTPTIWQNKIQEYSNWPNFLPIYQKNYSLELVKEIISSYLPTSTEYLITTTIDNDDALVRDYIEIIQDNFHGQKFELLNFRDGYVWHTPTGNIYLRGTGSNPFITMIEAREGFQTVWVEPHNNYHGMYHKSGYLKQITLKPGWIQVVHGGNLYNGVNGIRQPRKNLKDDFTINVSPLDREENILAIWIEQRWNYITAQPWVRKMRTKLALKTRLLNLLRLVQGK